MDFTNLYIYTCKKLADLKLKITFCMRRQISACNQLFRNKAAYIFGKINVHIRTVRFSHSNNRTIVKKFSMFFGNGG